MAELFFLVYVGTTVWVVSDASRRDWSQNSFAKTPATWALGMLLGWIIVFPVYLFMRGNVPRKQATA
jgi:hypothetical protein